MKPETEHPMVVFGQHRLTLLPSGAIYCAALATLWVADVHLGKAATYRQLGQPVPQGTTTATLAQLSKDLQCYSVKHLVVLGDFLHGPQVHRSPSTLRAIEQWREQHFSCDITLIRGNHDDRAGDPPQSLSISVVDEPYALSGIACCHDKRSVVVNDLPVLWGHIHPVTVLKGRARERLRLPCFVVAPDHILLPAYGAFTGGHAYTPASDETLYVIADQSVLKLPGPASIARQGSPATEP
ncbi:MAG TPA: ligase-associated DNA damage response endonuclease PdeM [Orrella sp.]